MTVRVVVADDQELIRTSLETVLGADPRIDVVGTAADGLQAVDACRQHAVDVVVMDVRMPRMNGIDATRAILQLSPRTSVLILTTFDLDEYVFAAIRAGASGFLTKDSPGREIVEAVCRVADGDAVVAPRAARSLLSYVRTAPGDPARADEALTALSPREREVVALLATGASNDEIGARLYLTTNTVKTHVKSILGKLGLADRIHVVIWAYEHGVAGR
ncbi:response regulator transcription factor [Microbacterium lushaniae]|uniref:Response regulator transcription factor n=1 Tax=Microbacterium lushaniae TaxID=2614639 RepID=A0A5J5JCB5_9MICO|nr:response regulator transcription factor [Microbacterium lushaniae]KAA9144630.1 response regulator transcription factor [Microbacterium lushaniae]KAA9147440.1 response regulator transcription factor [Microbacterium lushaniae]QEW03589.1 response regulator transcription factor [Microbacterium lushaniae]